MHSAEMAARLPRLYAGGDLVQALLDVVGTELEVLDEDLRRVAREHRFDDAVDLDDAAKLAALLDLTPEPFHDLPTFRAWVHALRRARVANGSVTVDAITGFVTDYASAAGPDVAARLGLARGFAFGGTESQRARFVENPPRRRELRAPAVDPAAGGVEPLQRFTVTNGGLDDAPLGLLLRGLPSGPEHAPLIVNLRTGRALILLDTIRPGERLWLSGTRASLEGRDVSAQLRAVETVTPGEPWTNTTAAQPLILRPGDNDLWFLPVAHFGVDGLDRVLLALADLELGDGRFDSARFDHALFHMEPAVSLDLAWVEAAPAEFAIALGGGILDHPAGRLEAAVDRREELVESIGRSVDNLRAAGVRSSVTELVLTERQPTADRLVATSPLVLREGGATGVDALPDAGGLFGVTPYDHSTFR